jgi:hypothetical protein
MKKIIYSMILICFLVPTLASAKKVSATSSILNLTDNIYVGGYLITENDIKVESHKLTGLTTAPAHEFIFKDVVQINWLRKFSETEIVVQTEKSHWNPPQEHTSVYVMKVDADGNFKIIDQIIQPDQWIIGRIMVMPNQSIVVDVHHVRDPNKADDTLVYSRKSPSEKFELMDTLVDTSGFEVALDETGPYRQFISRHGYAKDVDELYDISPLKGESKIIYKAGYAKGQDAYGRKAANTLQWLTGDIFLETKWEENSDNLRDLKILSRDPKLGLKTVGQIPYVKKYDYTDRYVTPVNKNTFVIMDTSSYGFGLGGFHRDEKFTVVTVENNLIKKQFQVIDESCGLPVNKIRNPVSVFSLTDDEFLLVMANYVTVVRKQNSKFVFAESFSFNLFDKHMREFEFKSVSKNRFVLYNSYILGAAPVNDQSEIHIFDKSNGSYKYSGRILNSGLRVKDPIFLDENTALLQIMKKIKGSKLLETTFETVNMNQF